MANPCNWPRGRFGEEASRVRACSLGRVMHIDVLGARFHTAGISTGERRHVASLLVRPTSARSCQTLVLTPACAVARSEQIEARGKRNPEACGVSPSERRLCRRKLKSAGVAKPGGPRCNRCDAYRHGAGGS